MPAVRERTDFQNRKSGAYNFTACNRENFNGNDPGRIHVQKEKEVGQQAVGTQIKMCIVNAEIWIGRKAENSRQESASTFGFTMQYSQLRKRVFKSSPQDEGYCSRSSSNSLHVV